MTSTTRLVLFLSFLLFTSASCAPDEAAQKANAEKELLAKYQEVVTEKVQIARELQMKIKEQKSQQSIASGLDENALAPLTDVRKRQQELLEQLVKNNPGDSDHRFKLAMLHMEQKDARASLEILQQISPRDTPGHAGGHLVLAKYFIGRTAQASKRAFEVSLNEGNIESRPADSQAEAVAASNDAINHLGHCLTKDPDNVEALRLKGSMHKARGQHAEALELFDRLFKNDPKYYASLCELNTKLQQPDKNGAVLDSAITRFGELLDRAEPLSDQQQIFVWQELTKCHLLKGDTETIKSRLIEAFQLGNAADESETRSQMQSAAARLLSSVYLLQAKEYSPVTEDSARARLGLIRNAYQWDRDNPQVLLELTGLGGNGNPSVANEALSIYDPKNDIAAPAAVLGQLGVQELAREDYDLAIRYLERALSRDSRNPEILNNLAFAFLQGESSKPARSLNLVDEAIRLVTGKPGLQRYQTFFQDTRGKALMQLQRYQDAIVAFEVALKTRPQNQEILESVVACYQQLGMQTPVNYENQLRKIQERTAVGN